MFAKTTPYYDKIYSFKDYKAEAERVVAICREYLRSERTRWLDLAWGTDRHLEYLRDRYEVEGLDIALELLAIACQRIPGIPFHHADMIAFDLGKTFDIVTYLFNEIGRASCRERV